MDIAWTMEIALWQNKTNFGADVYQDIPGIYVK